MTEKRTRPVGALGLLDSAEQRGDWSDVGPITGLSVDSREVKPGHLFAALPGVNLHGGEFITYAQRMGAAVALTDAEGAELARWR